MSYTTDCSFKKSKNIKLSDFEFLNKYKFLKKGDLGQGAYG